MMYWFLIPQLFFYTLASVVLVLIIINAFQRPKSVRVEIEHTPCAAPLTTNYPSWILFVPVFLIVFGIISLYQSAFREE
jgi:hypothetical protein